MYCLRPIPPGVCILVSLKLSSGGCSVHAKSELSIVRSGLLSTASLSTDHYTNKNS